MPTVLENSLKSKSKLWTIIHRDPQKEIFLKNYSDTVIFDSSNGTNHLIAVRFGGYPEHARAMADAIYGGGSAIVQTDDGEIVLSSYTKRYRRSLSKDGVYAEATLLLQDDEQQIAANDDNSEQQEKKKEDAERNCFIFCEQDNPERLFEEIDKKVAVPLIPEFMDYVISELQRRSILKKLNVFSFREKMDAWKLSLTANDENVVEVIENGLFTGKIAIPGNTDGNSEFTFQDVNSVTGYLNKHGVEVAEKIKGLFNPVFDPATEPLSKEILDINENIRKNTGYSLYDAHVLCVRSIKITSSIISNITIKQSTMMWCASII